ncbi:hypothetical protein MBCUT_04120 [Methanobrevibacter cuticularis]|uniref:Right handed beta helix domain-containing protein n=1 Tax=Methanobrevibacter cuticularis TaxID=47311 RepID=A0A166ETY1_9EURY|nr:carboxypeptidase-like regulatory domain-containing protein [Methanobrevibacter cuticularis]KZX17009.1 hypothetical protein MBCUT_04120 [Methanobrevibacter cuticularis]
MFSKINNLIENGFLSIEPNIHLFNRARLRNVVLLTFLFLCFFAVLSGVSGVNFNSSSTNAEIQAFLDNASAGDNEVTFEEGNYSLSSGLTVGRSVNISSTGQVNMVGTNTGTLFTITAPNVQITKLNISRYNTAINSNRGNLSIIACNINTTNISVHLSGNSLTDVLMENNTIISSVSTTTYGAVYVTATAGSVVNIAVKGNNITVNGTSNSMGVRFTVTNCNNTLFFDNNNITGTLNYGVYLYAPTNSNNTITITNSNSNSNITGTYGVYIYAETSNNNITITNNNITGTSYGVYLRAATSNNNITITNNNITGTSGQGVYLYTPINSNNTITITSNNITGTADYGVYLYARTNSNNTITITNSNITGKSGYGVYLDVYTSNNNITITNNNITGTSGQGVYLYALTNSNNTITITNNNITGAYGVYLDASTSNNNITITNNNITGTSRGVQLLAPTNSNNTITITNNNITGTSGQGVYLGAYINSNNNITITNNNITATYGYSLVLYAFTNSNNNITITNNNITGTSYGVAMDAFTNINNNITITNNNITGTSGYGVLLRAETSNNTISVNDNNIRGASYGMSFNCNNLSFSGLSVVNNTINATNATGIGIGVVNLNSTVLRDILVFGNNIFAGTTGGIGISFATGLASVNNVTINYNRVLAAIGLSIPNTVSGVDANLNWWGNNTPNLPTWINNYYIVSIVSLNGEDYYILSLNGSSPVNSTIVVNSSIVQIGENVLISGQFDFELVGTDASLLPYFGMVISNSSGNTTYDARIPRKVSNIYDMIIVDNQTLTNSIGLIFDIIIDGNKQNNINLSDTNAIWSTEYTSNRTGNITAEINSTGNSIFQQFRNTTTFTVDKASTNSTIVVSPNPAQIGENITVSGVLANYTGVTGVNVTVDGTLFTNVAVDGFGYWELNYTTNHTGIFDVVVSFAGNGNYDAFSNSTFFAVNKNSTNSTINIPSNVKMGKTITIDGVLVDENGNPIANAPINVTVDGKVYTLTTDSNGRWSLTYKPTHTGNVNIMVDYAGNDKYFRYTNTTTFNVIKGKVIVDVDVVKNSDGSADVIVTVTDEDGDPIHDYKVSVDLDGKNIGNIVTNVLGVGKIHIPSNKLGNGRHVITVTCDDENYNVNPVSVEFETQNNDNDNNDTNTTNKTNNNPVASATMKNTGIPIIAVILVLISMFGIILRRKI